MDWAPGIVARVLPARTDFDMREPPVSGVVAALAAGEWGLCAERRRYPHGARKASQYNLGVHNKFMSDETNPRREPPPLARLGTLVLAADLAGTLLFAVEGGFIAIDAHLDVLGIAVIAFVTALGGGVLRDVLLGDAPPAALRDARYPLLAFAGAWVAILARWHAPSLAAAPLVTLDAAALALFAVAGAEKSKASGCNGLTASLLGMLTGVGGGATRDVLLGQIPAILHTGFYATAAFAGGVVVAMSQRFGVSPRTACIGGGLACFALRLGGAFGHWHLPAFG
jgi:uncharacterized membrane protein YeiH